MPYVLKKRVPVDWFKFAMSYLATIGFILIFIEDYLFQSEDAGTTLMMGDGYSLGYSLIYAVYTVKLSEITGEIGEEKFRYNLFLGFQGLLNVVVMIPILFIFDVTGFEDLQSPDLNYTLIMIP